MLYDLNLQTKLGNFTINHHLHQSRECVSLSLGNISTGVPLVRMHSSCLFSEAFQSLDCDCALQLEGSLKLIQKEGSGVCIYLYDEGRGHGLKNKIMAMKSESDMGIDTVEAFKLHNLDLDIRDYTCAIQALKELGTAQTIRLISNNHRKGSALTKSGFEIVSFVELEYQKNDVVMNYLKIKRDKLGHKISKL